MIEYISMKRTLFADVNTNPPKDSKGNELLLSEEYLVAAVIMGLPEEMRKSCMNKKLTTMINLETKLSAGKAMIRIEINRIQSNKSTEKEKIDLIKNSNSRRVKHPQKLLKGAKIESMSR